MECFGLEETFKGYLAQPPCSEQGHLLLDQAGQSPVQPGLECFQGWGINHLSGQSVPVFHHPHHKKISSLALVDIGAHCGAVHRWFSLLQLTPRCACAHRPTVAVLGAPALLLYASECLFASMKAATSKLFHNLPLQEIKLISMLFEWVFHRREKTKRRKKVVYLLMPLH